MDTEQLQRLDGLLGDPDVPDEDKRRAVAMARVQDSQTTTTPTTEESALERGAGYLATRGKDWWEATNRMFQPESLAYPLQELGDVATATAPVVAPFLTAAGVLAGTTARTAGLDPGTAGEIESGVNLIGGASQIARGIYSSVRGAGQAANAARAAAETQNAAAREAAQAANAAAGPAARAARTAAEVPAGRQMGAEVPAMRQTVAKARADLFDPIVEYAENKGFKLPNRASHELYDALRDAQDEFADIANPAEKRVVTNVLDKLSRFEDLGAKDIDKALRILNEKAPKAFGARKALTGAMTALAEGTPIEGRMSVAGRQYWDVIKPARHFADRIAKAGTPGQAAQNTVRMWRKLGPESQALIDPTGATGRLVEQLERVAIPNRVPMPTPIPVPEGSRAGLRSGIGGAMGAASMVPRAYDRFSRGDIVGGITELATGFGIGAVAGSGRAAALGAIRPAGQAAVSFAQTPSVRRAFAEFSETPTAPSDLEDTPDEPTIQRTTPAPAGPTRDRRAAVTPGRWGREIDAVSRLAGVPVPLLQGVMRQESGGNPNALSHPEPGQAQTPAHGLMQITPGTFKIYRDKAEELLGRKADISNPFDNLLMGGLLYRNYLDKTGGDVEAAGRLYFGGGGTGPRTRQYGRDIASQYTRALTGR